MSYKTDLHTHSYGSPDGGLLADDYRQALQRGSLNYIAITDHNAIAAARDIQQALGQLGDRIIIGEEIMTDAGEIIGLYLSERIEAGLSVVKTISRIRQQGGIVYIPHPFETVRSGLSAAALDSIACSIDIIETCNGRAIFQNRGQLAQQWASGHDVPGAASSDSHGRYGWGRTYAVISQPPTCSNLAGQLHKASLVTRKVGIGVVYPKYNRLRKAGRAKPAQGGL